MNDEHIKPNHPRRLLFFSGEAHACSYLPGQQALSVFADPNADMDSSVYDRLAQHGFRRSGEHIYTPKCPECTACLSLRVPVNTFRPNRSQRRAQKRLSIFTVHQQPAEFNEQHFQLYRKYLTRRHPGGGMDEATEQDYMGFLAARWSDTRFVSLYYQNQLIAVTVTDVLSSGLSAVYTFFDPDASHHGPGQLAILWLIEEARHRNLPYVYLGYWVEACTKMTYKAHYQPAEIFTNGTWMQLERKI